MKDDKNLPIILGRSFLATRRTIIDVYKGKLSMRMENQVISFNMFKKVDSSSDINDCYRVNLMKEGTEYNSLKKALLINYKASIVHLVDVEAKKAQENTNVMEAIEHSSNFNPLVEVIEPLLSFFSHHKPYKKDFRK
ncbi:hypothetical protein PanWU01x14_178540 [Parasponia andersonii]|uniref:Uncharacterized protein n=1 Tax=Parasponia andersonii TaxID=3476 RepID=A0A2P5C728_PARAD|nr:hypothetical protein PanWU01x14_178540 [Parasponia andersonii]